MPALLSIGDVLTLRGVDPSRAPQRWRVARLDAPLELVLQPINADGSVNEFLDACGDLRLAVTADTRDLN
jgi:hypothetical protein